MELKQGAVLQGGRYIIGRVLGQGGFGITYLGTQAGLDRRVAIKEFFMKEHCNRNASTSRVSVGSVGARQLVDACRQKFLKEARTLAEMDNRHIVRVIDVFEENGTAYYVMEYVEGGSLKDLVQRRGSLPEAEALGYIRQLAEALAYLHARRVMHLDVKPGNLMLRPGGELVLIDFGIAKHYDTAGGQTSSTPVGISAGYAPMEQYQEGGVREFSPATDIYSAGATLYFLLTATTPPSAQEVYENGLPALPRFVSAATGRAVSQAMQPRRKDRPQTAEAFLALLPPTGRAAQTDADNVRHLEEEQRWHDRQRQRPEPRMERKPSGNLFRRLTDYARGSENRAYGILSVLMVCEVAALSLYGTVLTALPALLFLCIMFALTGFGMYYVWSVLSRTATKVVFSALLLFLLWTHIQLAVKIMFG